MKRYVKASIGTLEQQEQAEGMAMVLPRKALLRARLDVVMVLPQKAPLRARLDVVMVLPQKAPLQARPQEPLQARPQEPLREPQSEMVQAFITQSEAQPSEILRPLLQFRPTACVVHAEGSYAAESALAAITLTGFGCGPEFPPLSIVARARLANCRRHRRLSASAGVAASRRRGQSRPFAQHATTMSRRFSPMLVPLSTTLVFAMSLHRHCCWTRRRKNGFQTGNVSSWRGSLYGH
jgi:hypothetical protein